MSSGIFNHRSNDSGSVLVALVVIALIVGGGVLAGLKCTASLGRNQSVAEAQLDSWARKLNIKVAHRICNSDDSDGDDYVACSYTGADGSRVQVECAAAYNLQNGCRDQKVTVPAATTHVHVESSSRR